MSLGIGAWFPTYHLQTIGVHPSFDVSFGVRNKWNEYDFSTSLRFIQACQQYRFVYEDTLLTSRDYDGGTLALEYTRFFLHEKYFEMGAVVAAGADFLDGPSDADENTELEIRSFNFNYGLRIKYFFKRRGFIGLTAKYHMIHYSNPGGTNLDGNAFSMVLSFGSH
jgi:hypothetical protein